MKRVAVIGSGIGGIAAAYELKKKGFHVSLFEKGSYFGGHTHTHHMTYKNEPYTVDTGFLVHNDRTYPHLVKFFEELGLKTYPSEMSFSVCRPREDLEWSGTNLLTVFGQYKNLLKPRFHRFLQEIVRFNKMADKMKREAEADLSFTLGDLLFKYQFSKDFQRWYLLPMGGCIWSSPMDEMLKFPAYTFLHFCHNHGLLQISNRPQWKTVVGGCDTYTKAVVKELDEAFLHEEVLELMPLEERVEVTTQKRSEVFDAVVLAGHPPQSLKLIEKFDKSSAQLLKNFQYQKNTAFLHTDRSHLPLRKRLWSSWNYRSESLEDGDHRVSVSYLINKLQSLPFKEPIVVTLNPIHEVKESHVIKEIQYEHPLFDAKAVQTQPQIMDIQGKNKIYYTGAWLRYGFHEDGIWSAKKAVGKLVDDMIFSDHTLVSSQEISEKSNTLLK